MSRPEEPSHKNHQTETEPQEEDEPEPDEPRSKEAQVKEFLQPSQEDKRAISPLNLLKEDFSQFREEVKKKCKDKDTNTTTNPSTEKLVKPLSFLKEEINHFKEGISSVFRISLSKDQDNKDETADAFKNSGVKSSKTKRAEDPLTSLFRRDRTLLKVPQKAKGTQEENRIEDQTHFRGNLTKKNKEMSKTEKSNNMKYSENKSKDSEMKVNDSKKVMKRFTSTPQSERMFASKTDVQRCSETEDLSEGHAAVSRKPDEPSETSLKLGMNLFSLNLRNQPTEDLRSPKNYATYLTLDPNTASAELHLANSNRKAIRDWLMTEPSDHPDRFKGCPQVLCREGLLDLVYWEVVWTGGVDIGVTYNSLSRNGDTTSCLLGHNVWSWSLECSEGNYTPCHNNKRFKSSSPEPFTHRVGVYLNWPAGTLSFYCISQDAMVHLHTFTSTFTEPVYPGFWVWACEGSVSLCQVELDWERLLQ